MIKVKLTLTDLEASRTLGPSSTDLPLDRVPDGAPRGLNDAEGHK